MTKVAKVKQSSICCRNRNGRKYYYCWIKGTQHGLGYDREAADAKYKELLNGKPASEPEPQPAPEPVAKPCIKVADVLREFLAWLDKEAKAGRASAGTLNFYRRPIAGLAKSQKSAVPFLDYIGDMNVDEFGENVVKHWIDTHYANGTDNYKITLLRPIKRAFKWACSKKSERLLTENPIDELELPTAESREVEITELQWAEVEPKAPQPLRDLLIVLKETGARPQELRAAESKHLQANGGKPRLYFAKPVKKTRGKQKPRKIYLNERAYAICKQLAEQYPTGKLFRTKCRTDWKQSALTTAASSKRLKLSFDGFGPYALRHTFCTTKLRQGMPPATVAELMGTSVEMVMKVYNQLGLNDDYLYQALTA
jgi:integrase